VPWGYTSMSPQYLIAAAIVPLHRAAGPIGIFELVLPAEPAVAPAHASFDLGLVDSPAMER
jgi:hypothetical protein